MSARVKHQLRRLLARYPGLFRAFNAHAPAPVLQLARRLAERIKFSNADGLHDLPPIASYWSQTHLQPMLQAMGYANSSDFLVQQLLLIPTRPLRILSIGSGDGAHDIHIATQLKAHGLSDFDYECVDSHPGLIEAGRRAAAAAGLTERLRFTCASIESLPAALHYDAVIAIQFLHHVVPLEALFTKIHGWLSPQGRLLVDDMIGRNGHMRWPEAEAEIRRLWATLDARYKYHHLHGVVNHEFVNWDCSLTGYEGIRAQDIVPLLLQHFHFETFIGFGNLIDIFIDRPYGPNFSPENPQDRAFIDAVQALDERLLQSGDLSPTHMIAALQTTPPNERRLRDGITPEACLRGETPRT